MSEQCFPRTLEKWNTLPQESQWLTFGVRLVQYNSMIHDAPSGGFSRQGIRENAFYEHLLLSIFVYFFKKSYYDGQRTRVNINVEWKADQTVKEYLLYLPIFWKVMPFFIRVLQPKEFIRILHIQNWI